MIPYSTDAPIYHLPIATVTLIVLNVLLFFTCDPLGYTVEVVSGYEDATEVSADVSDDVTLIPSEQGVLRVVATGPSLALQYGTLKPWQWFTSIFMHSDILHLGFNMIFLWSFGLIVEGKVGHWVFLALYMAIGAGQSAIEQMLMFWASEGGSLGASAAIAGLLGIVLVWAPRNEFDCWWGIGFYANTFEVPVTLFAGLWLLEQTVFMLIGGANWGGELLHLMGFGMGFAAGILWLAKGWVDCEGYDLLAVWKGTDGQPRDDEEQAREVDRLLGRAPLPAKGNSATSPKNPTSAPKKRKASTSAPAQSVKPAPTTSVTIRQQVSSLIAEGHYAAAAKLFDKLRSHDVSLSWKQEELVGLVKLAMQQKDYAFAEPYLQTLMDEFPSSADTARVALGRIYLYQQRPSLVLALYRDVNPALLDEKNRSAAKQLVAAAKKQQAAGVVELAE